MSNHTLFLNDLRLHCAAEVLDDKVSLGVYSTDASVYQIMPICIVLPKTEAEVISAVRIAVDHGISILPRGGGTSLAGQTVGHSMILDFSKNMNQILEINPTEQWVRVQPGRASDDLNSVLKAHGLIFAPDPATSSRANVGGMIGNNSSGTKSILYGKTVDHVLELKVLLADGTVLKLQQETPSSYSLLTKNEDRAGEIYLTFQELVTQNEAAIIEKFPTVMRRVQGYNLDEFAGKTDWNLSKLICGSEGTLAIILEAKLNLVPLPKYKSVCVVHFSELLPAIEAVNPMLSFQPSCVEILDNTVLELSRQNLTTQRHCHFIEGHPAAIQIVEFYGDTQEEVLERPRKMVEHLKALGFGYAYPIFPQGPAYEDVWVIRKKGLGLMLGVKGPKTPLAFIEDSGIPTEHLPEYIDRVLKVCKKNGTEAAMYAHASVGVIHVRPILDLRLKEDIERFKRISEETFELVKEYGGSWSGEHGDGLVRSYKLPEFFGPQVYGVLRAVKELFDPNNLMNPGKIIDAQGIAENLRYGAAYSDQEIPTVFKYLEDGSFQNAIHQCTGVGECRRVQTGTMCPSFKATRDEVHSTRGRANALRLAMSGQLPQDALTSKGVIDALDLCLSCKACKSECPSNVDMAKLKSEIWQKKFDQQGIPLRDRFIRDSSNIAKRFAGALAPPINAFQKTGLFRYGLEKVMGIEKERVLPTYARHPFYKWFEKRPKNTKTTLSKVVLFADTYLNFHEPNIGIAATQLLEALGYEVLIAKVGCCQRPKLSNGFLKAAKKEGTHTANELAIYMQQNLPIVVCEPSCASALVDDLPDLLEDRVLAQQLKSQVQMIDTFLLKELEKGNIQAPLPIKKDQVTIHGHCHQKALFGTKAMQAFIDPNQVSEIPSGCCGMAGSFGYEKEHYAISKKIGAEILFPAVERLNDQESLVACGVSCRHQIDHFTKKQAIHWVEIFDVDAIKAKNKVVDEY